MHTSATENLGYYKMKQHKLWFDEECSKLLHQRKQTKLQWLQNSSQINGDNMNNVRCDIGRTSRNRKRKYVNEKINEFQTNSKNKNI